MTDSHGDIQRRAAGLGRWPSEADPILKGDQVVALAHRTPAQGVVLTPATNFGVHDRLSGRLLINSSIGMWRKLKRIRQDPQVAVAFHSRFYSRTSATKYSASRDVTLRFIPNSGQALILEWTSAQFRSTMSDWLCRRFDHC